LAASASGAEQERCRFIATGLAVHLRDWHGYEDDPGLTTEIALIVTTLLGGLSMQKPALAAGLAVSLAGPLAARSRLHHFVRSVITEDEMPLAPDRPMGPYDALNPHSIWILVILVMAIGAAGYVAVRMLGARVGLPIAGLASGFISSTATIGAMAARAAKTTDVLAAAVAAAVLSTIATIVQMAIVLAATSMTTLRTLSIPLICAGFAAIVYGAIFTIQALQQKTESEAQSGRAFSLTAAIAFALTLSSILVASAALQEWFGETGVVAAAALAGFVDTHSSAISVASLVVSGKMNAADAVFPILAGLSTNTISKMLLAGFSGGRSFALRVIPGLIFVALAAWAGALTLNLKIC
jgi:uncharacterized membrane protein (DUF4010 family)